MDASAADPPVQQDTVIQRSNAQKTELSAIEQLRAEHWGLSPTEWRRYRGLMEGIRGRISPSTLSPIEVLGIHARDEDERRRYAEQWAIVMREDAERILAFQRAYNAAMRRLFPNEALIDVAQIPQRSKEPSLLPSDRILLFARRECPACEAVLERLLSRLEGVAGIDIYLSAVDDEKTVREWAAARGIEPDWVRARKVTLNLEAGILADLVNGSRVLPVLLRRRGESVTPLPAGVL
jgi:integrating conjugative element protein (TIGR03759 family)